MSEPFRLLIDENLPPWLGTALLREVPTVQVRHIGEGEAPPKGTPDPEILLWCEQNGYFLVTNNRASMPMHLARHLEAGLHCPGILLFRGVVEISLILEELALLASASDAEEWRDQILRLPL